MNGACLLFLVAALGAGPVEDAGALVARLGSARFADREAAAKGLERLGKLALPALEGAREARDPEVRARALALLGRIEAGLLVEATLLRARFDDVPLPEVVQALGGQAGVKLALMPENLPDWQGRRVTWNEPAPLPFWKALDRLCELARLQYNAGMNTYAPGREPTLPLFEGGMRPTNPVFDSGPFRVTVVSLHYQSDVNFPPGPALPRAPGAGPERGPGRGAVNEQFFVQLQVAAEPRLTLALGMNLKELVAVDDQGQDLAGPAAGGPLAERSAGYFGLANGSVGQVQVPLVRRALPGKALKRLAGRVPVTVSHRKGPPLVVPLTGPAARSAQNEDATVTVHEVRAVAENRQSGIDLTVRLKKAGASRAEDWPLQPETFPQQIEVIDGEGKVLPWYQTSYDGESGRMTLTLPPLGADPIVPAELRFYGLARAAADVPFEFADVPLPRGL